MAREMSLGNLVTEMIARSKKYEAGMKKGAQSNRVFRGSQRRLGRSTSQLNKQMASFKKTLLGLAGVGGFGALVAGASKAAIELDRAANRFGLSASSLQDFTNAARVNFIEVNQAINSYQRFTRRLGEAQQGTGELLSALEQYNIALFNNQGRARSVEAVLLDYADAVGSAATGQEQLRLSVKAFDQEGGDLVRLLKDGRQGLIDFSVEGTERFGKFTQDSIDNLKKLQLELDSFRLGVFSDIANVLGGGEGASNSLARLGVRLTQVAGNFAISLTEGILKAANATRKVMTSVFTEVAARFGDAMRIAFARVMVQAESLANIAINMINRVLPRSRRLEPMSGAQGRLDAVRGAAAGRRRDISELWIDSVVSGMSGVNLDAVRAPFNDLMRRALSRFSPSRSAPFSRASQAAAAVAAPAGGFPGGGGVAGARGGAADRFTGFSQLQELTQSQLGGVANQIGFERGLRFQSLATGGFQRFENGRAAGTFTENQLRRGVARQAGIEVPTKAQEESLKNQEKANEHLEIIRAATELLVGALQSEA